MKPIEIRDLDTDQLLDRIRELKEEMFNLRFQLATGQMDNHRRMKAVRADIARIRTIMREREIEEWERGQAAAVGDAEAGEQ